MKVERNQTIFVGESTRSQELQEKQGSRQKKGSVFAGELNMPQDKILQRRQQAQKKALKVVADAWDGDRKIDADLASRGEKVRALQEESKSAKEEMAAYEKEKETLRQNYGVEADSDEQKDLELLLKQREADRPGSGVTLTEEEQKRLEEIGKQERTEYQSQVLEMDEAKDYYRDIIEKNDREIGMENAIIRGIGLERLKREPMLEAQKEADAIKEAANEEIIGMLVEEGMNHIDEEQDEREEKAEELKEKKEEQEELIEKRRDESEEAKKRAEELAEDMPTQEYMELEQMRTNVQKEVQDIVEKMNLVAEDIKGSLVDDKL